MANEETNREIEFTKTLKEIEFQALRVREIGKHSLDVIGDLLQEKSLDLLGAMINFFSSCLLYFRHGFFCSLLLLHRLLSVNLGKTIVTGSELYNDGVNKLQLAVKEYDQALVVQIANHLFSITFNVFR